MRFTIALKDNRWYLYRKNRRNRLLSSYVPEMEARRKSLINIMSAGTPYIIGPGTFSGKEMYPPCPGESLIPLLSLKKQWILLNRKSKTSASSFGRYQGPKTNWHSRWIVWMLQTATMTGSIRICRSVWIIFMTRSTRLKILSLRWKCGFKTFASKSWVVTTCINICYTLINCMINLQMLKRKSF